MGLLGKEVRSSHELKGLPIGTPGRIIQVRLGGKRGFSVAVQWQCESLPSQDEFTKDEFERFMAIADTTGINLEHLAGDFLPGANSG